MAERVCIFDTTLRDGEQSPGASMGLEAKVQLALQLERLGVDVIEAGFPMASEGELVSVREIAAVVTDAAVAALTRTRSADIDKAWQGVKDARRPRIHVFIATSDIHLEHKLRLTREEVLAEAVRAVRYAKGLCPDVEFSAEDATRSDRDFLCRVVEAVIEAGATVVNLPDTVGYAVPPEIQSLFEYVRERVPETRQVTLSAHCHNDLGLAVANSLAAVTGGARQVECTVNGIGERAGNAALEEIVMALKTRHDMLPFVTGVRHEEIYRSSRLLANITGLAVPRNKPIVGKNAFAHEAGVHQHGVIQKALTYEIMRPEEVGQPSSELVLGKHSGKHGLRTRLSELGYTVTDEEVREIYDRFMALADKKREVYDADLVALMEDAQAHRVSVYDLEYFHVTSGRDTVPTATVRLREGETTFLDSATGDGPVDATYRAIDRITGTRGRLVEYTITAVTTGKDALGEVFVRVEFDGTSVVGRGTSTDVIEASALAYLSALNKAVRMRLARGARAGSAIDLPETTP